MGHHEDGDHPVLVANLGGYLDGVIDAINGIKEGFSGSDNIWQLLDTLWNKAKVLGKRYMTWIILHM